ncbi:hypothetical protein I553_9046 [Mycobacterium xenopi 4042]|uniref:Uncharacterized protein n=1 Tax=Mycobacterium xenopi 4042 TaxID=1299334 RepID=X8APE3_MYCXE|nr:hypothetical protein I553_9046 [Mycobacterium xenopi 4042]
MFAGHRAAGINLVIQCVWIYEHPVDFDGLTRFHRNLGYGMLGRRIEVSPLPFGRPRWVLDREPSDIDIAQCARPRAEVGDWAMNARNRLSIRNGGPAGISVLFGSQTAQPP